jgi:hypothetical protein
MIALISSTAMTSEPKSHEGDTNTHALSVRDTIESRQILYPYWFATHEGPIQFSPDRQRYVLTTIRGDLDRDGNVVEFFSGKKGPKGWVTRGMPSVTLFTRAKTRNWLRFQFLRWFDHGKSIAFLWKEEGRPQQVTAIDLESKTVRQISQSTTDVVSFDISESGDVVVYAADRRGATEEASEEMLHKGFGVAGQEISQLLSGHVANPEPGADPKLFVQIGRESGQEVVVGSRRPLLMPQVLICPGGRFAVVTAPPADVPPGWDAYNGNLAHLVGLDAIRKDISAETSIRQYWVIDTKAGKSHPLMNAPNVRRANFRAECSPDGSRVIVGPTFLPTEGRTESGIRGSAVADVDLITGRVRELPVPDKLQGTLFPKAWRSNGVVVLQNESQALSFAESDGSWKLIKTRGSLTVPYRPVSVGLEVLQDFDSPPALYGIDTSSKLPHKIFELNPELVNKKLGHTIEFHWTDSSMRSWTGTLYYPVGFTEKSKAAPLVVQLGGAPPGHNTFSLLGIDIPSAYAAQVLANHGIAVLNVHHPDRGFAEAELTPREPQLIQEGVESAVKKLTEIGIASKEHVGLLGFSRAGWYVQYILTHSQFDYAAANVCDNMDASYLQFIITGTNFQSEMKLDIGAAPIGDGMMQWLAQSPGFRTEQIRSPLRLERDEGGNWGTAVALASWETFSRMRALDQPVELYMIPDLKEGQHQLEGPRQQLASREGTVDWFDFWLNGHEDNSPNKREQYIRWRTLRGKHSAWLRQLRATMPSSRQ